MVGESGRAACLLGVVVRLLEDSDARFDFDQVRYEITVTAVRAKLDETTFNAARAEGRAMTLERAIEYALVETHG